MADQSDVATALAAAIVARLYPNGATLASIIAGPAGPVMCRIYRGWPTSSALNDDLGAGIANISVFPDGQPRDTTRYPATWRVPVIAQPTMAVAVSGMTVSFSGAAAAGQMAGIAVDNARFVYLVQSGDTTALVAAALGAQIIASGQIIQISGATVTIPSAAKLFARVEQQQTAIRESRRQSQVFRVSCWCPGPSIRDQIAAAIDGAMADMAFLDLVDGTSARITAAGGSTIDQGENAALYRRDLLYAADYATTVTAALPAMLFGTGSLATPAGELAPLFG
jgi:hypothetical protein